MSGETLQDAMILMEGVSKVFDTEGRRITALDRVDLRLPAGAFTALVGPSGAGKTTLLNLIGGLDHPTAGRITVGDLALDRAPDKALAGLRRQTIGFMFQDFHLLPHRTALENTQVPLLFGEPDPHPEATALASLETVGIAHLAREPVAHLSGGQRQRVALARALVRQPRLLLADEPVGNLDLDTGRGIVDLLVRLNRERGMTIVAASHDLVLLDAAEQVLLVEGGHVRTAPAHRVNGR